MKTISAIFEINSKETLKYRISFPKNFDKKKNQLWPIIIYLHGAGERGSNLGKLDNYGLFPYIKSVENFPFVVFAPLCPENEVWDFQYKNIMSCLDHISDDYKIDSKKVYLTGMSMGGQATWNFAIYEPTKYAAIAPVCGCIASPNTCLKLNKTPIWTFHGKKDESIPFSESERLVNILKPINKELNFTIYENNGHEVCSLAYENTELYKWLLDKSL